MREQRGQIQTAGGVAKRTYLALESEKMKKTAIAGIEP